MDLATYRETVREITPTDAAKELGVGYICYWRWETGRTTPRDKAMRKIMEWSDGEVTANDFLNVGQPAK